METNVMETPVAVKATGDKVLYSPKNIYVRIGSRQVRVQRIEGRKSMLPKEKNAQFFKDETIQRIASEWKAGTKDCIRGLNRLEEQMYLPRLISSKPDSPDWEKRVNEFWWNYTIDVPYSEKANEGGLILEAGFKIEDGKPTPIDLRGYMDYNFAKESKKVAPEGDENPLVYSFRLIDMAQQEIAEEEIFVVRKEADRAYLMLLKNAFDIKQPESQAVVDNILETVGGEKKKGISIYGLSDVKKQLELEKVKDRDFKGFLELLADKDLGLKSIITKGVSFGKISQEGQAYYYANKMMGRTLKEAVSWLHDPINSQDRMILTDSLLQFNK